MARADLSDFDQGLLQLLLPNKPRGVARVKDRRQRVGRPTRSARRDHTLAQTGIGLGGVGLGGVDLAASDLVCRTRCRWQVCLACTRVRAMRGRIGAMTPAPLWT